VDYFIVSMKASPRTLILVAVSIAILAGAAANSRAQDAIALKNGQTREGKIVGVKGGNVLLLIGSSTAGIPLAEVTEIRMSTPPEFEAAAAKLAAGDAKGSLAGLQKLNDTFAGLPTPWAERAAAMLGDAKLAAGDTEGAKQAYEQFSKTYPQATSLADLGMARLAVDAGQYDEAAKLLETVLAKSPETAFPSPADGPALAQGHYLLGRVREAADDKQGALEHYLKASAIFPFDANAATTAQARADALRNENSGLIAP
jgi:tetratricopeptide (TPR) repeat protein